MFKIYVLPIVTFLLIAPTFIEPAAAVPLIPNGLTTAAPPPDAQSVYYRGRAYYHGGARTGMAAGTATAAATTGVIGTGRDDVGTAVAGGPMASAVAGGCLPSVTYGYVVENARADGVIEL